MVVVDTASCKFITSQTKMQCTHAPLEVPTTKRVPLFVDETHVGAPRPPANSEGKAELSLDLDCHTLGRAARAAKSSQAPLTRSLMICVFWGIGSSAAGQQPTQPVHYLGLPLH